MYWDQVGGWYSAIDLYIVPSRFVRDILMRAGLPGDKITVLPHFVTDTIPPALPPSRPTQPYALYFGSLSETKGVSFLTALFTRLKVPLVLAGMAEDHFTPPRNEWITTVGQQSREALAALLQEAACVVSASPLPETFGLIALESIAAGKPFFGIRTGALPEIIKNGENGYLATDEGELCELLKKFFAGQMTFYPQAIRDDAQKRFGPNRYAERFEALCQNLIEEKKTR
jgi:glycosyltransferase involved in cell wall biosynthesis